jgi:universal stress protein E
MGCVMRPACHGRRGFAQGTRAVLNSELARENAAKLIALLSSEPVWLRASPYLRVNACTAHYSSQGASRGNLAMMETDSNRIGHIIVVVDPSAGVSQAAVDKASVLARCLDASVELLICDIETAHEDDLIRVTPRRRAPTSSEFFDLLDQLAAPLRAAGIKVKGRTIYGKSLHDSLLSYLCKTRADLIVKDTHHHCLAKRTLLRNTDWYLAHRCPVPVLFTKTKKWAAQPIIMAAVGSKGASTRSAELDRRILNCAASLAGGLKSDLHVIHTYVPVALVRAGNAGAVLATELEVEHAYERGQTEGAASAFGVTPARLHIEIGRPERCLPGSVMEYHADVIAIGASPHGRWHRIIVGSTASSILESLPCDVLVVTPLSALSKGTVR